MDQVHELVFPSKSPHPKDGPDIDLLNDETFGSGAVDDNWEGCHDNYVEQQSRNGSIGSHTKPMDDEELELSNQQLAAAVEELVLNSDQDQDVIDPAIVSLRKESKGSYNPKFTQNLMSPYMGEQGSFGGSSPLYSSQHSASSMFQNDGLRNIWNTPETDMHDSYSKSPSMVMERQLLNEKLRNMMKKSNPNVEFEDAAILTAVKSPSVPIKKDSRSLAHGDMFHPLYSQNSMMMKAEDLEKELSNSDIIRSPSPTYGISIPKHKEGDEDDHDRSLPARSVSPVIGSPSSNALPIGTPPKHITDMLQQAHMQGLGMLPRHPVPVVATMHQQRPRHGFHMPRMRGIPPNQRVPNMWPMGMMRPPMNPLLAKDIMNKLGANNNMQMMVGSPPRNMSPMGSPRGMRPPHMGMHPMVMRPIPIGMRGPMRIPPPYPNQRMPFPPFPIMHLGPGHLHPEHSRFVRMRRQQRGQHRPYNNHHRHNRDPYSNLMTSREKEWVMKIQMMALQSDRPEIDDYYYQHYIEKKLKEGNLSLDDDNNSEQKRLITPTKANPDHKKYVPVQYDNSLGKLTVSSVYNPRQIIDVIHAEKEDDQSTEPVDMNMSMNKRLEIYSVIEKCYSLLLVMEESRFQTTNGHLEQNLEDNDKKSDGEQKEPNHMKKLNGLLLPKGNVETIIQCLRVRKGKRLICRVLPHMTLDVSLQVILTLIKQLPVLIKKDVKENLLHEFYTPVCQTLCGFDLDAMVNVISALTPLSHSVCRDKFGLSLMCKIMTVSSKLIDDSSELETKTREAWSTFLAVCAKTILNVTKKNKNFSHASLDKDVLTTLEVHSKIFHANNSKIAVQLKEIRDLLVAKSPSQDDSSS